MKKFKKYFCIALAMSALICAAHGAVYAEGTSSSVSSVKFLSGGKEICCLPETGKTVTAAAEVSGDSGAVSILAAFDTSGSLITIATSTEGNVSINVTDATNKIRLLVWEGLGEIKPITGDEYTLSPADSAKILQGISVSGGTAKIKNNEDGNEINVTLPVWDASGNKIESYQVTAMTKTNGESITIGGSDATLGEASSVSADRLKTGKTITLTNSAGKSETYTVKLRYKIYDDFDDNTVFNNVTLTGTTTGGTSSSDASVTELIKSDTAKKYLTWGLDNKKNQYSDKMSIGVSNISNAKQIESKTTMPVGSSGASGKALKISKTSGQGSDDQNWLWFKVQNDAFNKADALKSEASSNVVVEYDMAFDYTNVSGTIGSTGGGIRFFANNTKYSLYDNKSVSSMSESPWLAATYNDGARTLDGTYNGPATKLNTWHHIKTILDPNTGKAATFIDGSETCWTLGWQDVSDYWTGDFLVSFQTSGYRGMDIWVDNLSVEWDSLPELESMTVAGVAAKIDNSTGTGTVTVDIPLWDKNGAAVDAENVSATLNAADGLPIKVGDKTVTNGAEATLDLSKAQKITVGKRTYDMIINRTIYDDFDDNTVFNNVTLTGTTTGGTTSSDASVTDLIKSDTAKQYLTWGMNNKKNQYSDKMSIGVSNISNAKQIESKTTMPVGSSGASGKALKISKTSGGQGSDENVPWFRITNAAFKPDGFTDITSSNVVVEYDMAFDYTNVNSECSDSLVIGSSGGGIRYFNTGKNYYTLFDEENRTSAFTSSPNLKLRYQDSNSYTLDGSAYKPLIKLNTWHHVKTVLDPINKKATTYIDNQKLTKGTGEVDISSLDVKDYWTDGLLVSFQTSGFRGMDIWVDNLSVSYTAGTTK